jgi:uncharacterized membrane protein YcjF (UPF0283 family)
MSEHSKETAFLKRLMALDDCAERRLLEARLDAAERNDQLVRRAMLGVGLLLGLSVAGLSYSAILLPDFPFNRSQLVLKVFLVLTLGSALCLAAYMCMWIRCRRFLNRLRDECRRVLETTLETRLQPRHGFPYPYPQAVNGLDWSMYQNKTLAGAGPLRKAV